MRTRPMIIAHRGLSGRFPENTLRAFKEALRLPIDAIEFDVRRTLDGRLVVIHDETVDRTTQGSGRVSELTWNEIKKLDAGSSKGKEFAGERIPSLDEALESINGQAMALLEIKEPGTEGQIIETIQRHNALRWVNLVSFHAEALASAKKIAPQLSYTLIGGEPVGSSNEAFFDFIYESLKFGANSVTVHYSTLTSERIHYCHERYIFVGTWTVDDKTQAERLISMGVDAIASNYSDIMISALAA
ncbi:MAG: glycerophosphodiester phosphodiesterase family protein [Actinomycetota bacterium]